MKVVLLRPPIVQLRTNLSSYGAILPIGLSYIAAVVRAAGHSVEVIDAPGEAPHTLTVRPSPVGELTFQGLMPDELVARIPETTQVLGVTHMFLHEWPIIREILEKVKKRFPHIQVVLGGENATAYWREIFTETDTVDYCVLGEGEQSILELLDRIGAVRDVRGLPGVVGREEGVDQAVVERPRIREIAKLPRPAWDLFPVESYLTLEDTHGVHRGRSMPILATRGCPFDCTFCSSPKMWTRLYGTRPPADVVAEIRDYVQKYRVANINFCDLTAIVRKEWIVEFCDCLAEQNFSVTWQLPTGTRTEVLDDEVLAKMVKTGCRNITYAPESGSRRMLQLMKKKVDLESLLRSLSSAVRARLVTRVNIIIGHPRETRRDTWQSFLFLVRAAWLGCDDTAVMIFAPYPGSEDTRNLIAETGLRFGQDYYYLPLARSGWSSRTYNPVMSTGELIFWQYLMLVAFYATAYLTRPWRIWKAFCAFTGLSGEATQLDQLLRMKFKSRGAEVVNRGA
ncbi:MAG: radical SAM protein [Candidatus Omnitrophota bacterium]|jgi:radical SAM superfamily enzyme YgiQ (UPF0313 family)